MTCWDAMVRPQPSTHSWDQAHRRPTIEETLTDAEAAILVTEWPELTTTDWTAARQAMNGTAPVLCNGCNHLDPNNKPATCRLDRKSAADQAKLPSVVRTGRRHFWLPCAPDVPASRHPDGFHARRFSTGGQLAHS
ncbi:hypothetical protein [Streptomyces aureus]|uniref:Uncharacterized protein n=1 Tax=Streptomyces aureus TaxID=193461 RepID=A0ABV4SZE4_9ACTN